MYVSSLRRYWSKSNVQYMKPTWHCPLMTTSWQQILLVIVVFSYSKKIWLNNELQTTPLLGVLTYFFGYETSLLLSLYVFLLTSKIFKQSQRINEVDFLIEVPTLFSSIKTLAKKINKKMGIFLGNFICLWYWQVRGTHQKKSGGHARFFNYFFL